MNCKNRLNLLLLSAAAVAFAGLGAAPLSAQEGGTIRGRVVEASSGRPTSSAQVFVPGTGRGGLTNTSGEFLLLNVPVGNWTVRVELLGYTPMEQTVTVASGQVVVVDFQLRQTAIGLDELVVTGTAGGTQKRAIGNVVTQVRMAEATAVAPGASVQQLLNARAPGLVVMPQTGQVGGSAKVRIRGASSMNLDNEPLIYVDGIRVDNANFQGPLGASRLNDFNPDDIESVEIIKGPAASTLYGTEAANGVIQIITKKGRIGTPTFGVTARMGTNEFANLEERMYTNWWRNPATGEVQSLNLATAERLRGTPLFETGIIQNYGVNVNGGTDAFRYYMSMGYDHENGIEPTNYVRRFNSKVNLTVFPKEGWDITASTGWTRSTIGGSSEGSGGGRTWGSYFSTPAHLPENIAAGSPPRRGYRSWVAELYDEQLRDEVLARFTGSILVNHRPTEWLTHRLTVGLDEIRKNNVYILEKTPLYLQFSPSGLGWSESYQTNRTFVTVDYSASVSRRFLESWASETAVGIQYYNRATTSIGAWGSDFALEGLRAIDATATRSAEGSWSEETSVGVFVQEQVGWNDRLFLTAAVRADDHSAFGENFDLVYYPKASATWVISEEEFFSLPKVSSLRLRAAWGASGQQPSAFAALRTFTSTVGPNDAATVTPSSPGNPDLGPQKASEVEVGFDAGLFDERAGLEFTYYYTKITDDILSRGAPPSMGFSGTQYLNLGESKKWGFETLLRGTVFASEKAALDATFSLSMNDSEVVDVGAGETSLVASSTWGIEHRVGYPLGSWFHVKVVDAELDATGKHIRSSMMCAGENGATVPCYTGSAITAPRVHLGRTIPKWEGAFSSTLTLFDNISLYGLMDFKLGHLKWDHNERIRKSLYYIARENMYPLEYDPVDIAAYQNSASFGAAYIHEADFAKLREVSLAYTLPNDLAAKIGATRATVSLSGRNLMTFTKWEGMEPEAMFGGSSFVMQEQNQIPQLRQFVFTTNLTF